MIPVKDTVKKPNDPSTKSTVGTSNTNSPSKAAKPEDQSSRKVPNKSNKVKKE